MIFPVQRKPCLNGGECSITFNDFVCRCPEEYTGKTCETRVWCVSNPCANKGQCVDLPDGYECKNICMTRTCQKKDIQLLFGKNNALYCTCHPTLHYIHLIQLYQSNLKYFT